MRSRLRQFLRFAVSATLLPDATRADFSAGTAAATHTVNLKRSRNFGTRLFSRAGARPSVEMSLGRAICLAAHLALLISATCAQAQEFSQVFHRFPVDDPRRIAAQPFGTIEQHNIHRGRVFSIQACHGVLISESYVLVPDCRGLKEIEDGQRLFIKFHAPSTLVSRRLQALPVEASKEFGYKILRFAKGEKALSFPPVSIFNGDLSSLTKKLITISANSWFESGCTLTGSHYSNVKYADRFYFYECVPGPSSGMGSFAYSFEKHSLVAINSSGAEKPWDSIGPVVIPIKTLVSRSPILTTIVAAQTQLEASKAQIDVHLATQKQASKAGLDARLAGWKARPHLYCTEEGHKFPSKMEAPPRLKCEDGDMNLFNGLLCAVGDEQGCKAVKDSQATEGSSAPSGSWWRSPKKIGKPDVKAEQTTFNSDQSLGIYAYLGQTGDASAFRSWLQWVKGNTACRSTSFECGWPGFPRVCTNNGDCSFRPIDCAMVRLFGELLGEQMEAYKLCTPLQALGLPTPDELLPKFDEVTKFVQSEMKKCDDARDALSKEASKFGVPLVLPPCPPAPPTLEELQKRFVDTVKEYEKQLNDLVGRLGVPSIGSAMAFNNVAVLALANAKVSVSGKDNPEGRHLAGVAALILKGLGMTDDSGRGAGELLVRAGKELAKHAEKNPLWSFLVEGPGKPEMLQLIWDKCPDSNFDKNNQSAHFQWTWERSDTEMPPPELKTMYWDCIFAAKLWNGNLAPLQHNVESKRRFPTIDPSSLGLLPPIGDIRNDISKLIENLNAGAAKTVSDILNLLAQKRIDSGINGLAKSALVEADRLRRETEADADRLRRDAENAAQAEADRLQGEANKLLPSFR
jgi:hypothetical protein